MSTHPLSRALFGAAVAASMSFGAAQALAAPAPREEARVCVFAQCAAECILRGHDGGTCLTTRSCICYDFDR